jgi:hypothetical protein
MVVVRDITPPEDEAVHPVEAVLPSAKPTA